MTTTVILLALAGVLLVAYLIRREMRLRWLRGTRTSTKVMLTLVLWATALAMGSVSFGAAISQLISVQAHVILLSLWLLALALGALQRAE